MCLCLKIETGPWKPWKPSTSFKFPTRAAPLLTSLRIPWQQRNSHLLLFSQLCIALLLWQESGSLPPTLLKELVVCFYWLGRGHRCCMKDTLLSIISRAGTHSEVIVGNPPPLQAHTDSMVFTKANNKLKTAYWAHLERYPCSYVFCCSGDSEEEIPHFELHAHFVNDLHWIPIVCRELTFLCTGQRKRHLWRNAEQSDMLQAWKGPAVWTLSLTPSWNGYLCKIPCALSINEQILDKCSHQATCMADVKFKPWYLLCLRAEQFL